MKNILVCGGAGFLGSLLVERLLLNRDVEHVVVYDDFSSGTRAHLAVAAADPKLAVVEANARDYDTLRATMKKWQIDTVFHLAANPDIARAVTEPDIDFRQGTVLTQNVLEAMRENGVARLFYTSGSGVYGDCGEAVLTEDYSCQPISTYGASKLAGEAMISAYCHMFEMSAVAFRFANVVGPRQTHGVGFDFVHRLWADPTRLRILGDGLQSKSYIHADDVLDAVLMLVDAYESGYKGFLAINVATDDYLEVNEIAADAIQVMGLPASSVALEYVGGARGWKGDVPVVRFDCGRIQSFGWKCKRTSRQAMHDALVAMRDEIGDKT